MEARLVVVGGKANKSEVKLKLPAMIGRSRDADITVSHASVSRHHCLVYELDGALVVRDNGSLNGTVVDGQRIKEALLKPGQSLTIGPLTFRADYEFDGEFPRLNAASPAASNGEVAASKPRSAAGPSQREPVEPKAAEPSIAEPERAEEPAPPAEAEDMEPPLPEVSAGEESGAEESAAGEFDFLDEEPAAAPTSSAPSFSFLKESNSSDDADIEDSTAVFRIADDAQPADAKPAEKLPARSKSADKSAAAAAKKAEKSPVRSKPAEKSAAAATKSDDDAELDDFLNSLGLEE